MVLPHEFLPKLLRALAHRLATVNYLRQPLLQTNQTLPELPLPLPALPAALLRLAPHYLGQAHFVVVVAVQHAVDVPLDLDIVGVVVLMGNLDGVLDLLDQRQHIHDLHLLIVQRYFHGLALQQNHNFLGRLLHPQNIRTLADLHHLSILHLAELVVVQAVEAVGVDELLGEEVLVLVRVQQSLAGNNEVTRFGLLQQNYLVPDLLLTPPLRQTRQTHPLQEQLRTELLLQSGPRTINRQRGDLGQRGRGVAERLSFLCF